MYTGVARSRYSGYQYVPNNEAPQPESDRLVFNSRTLGERRIFLHPADWTPYNFHDAQERRQRTSAIQTTSEQMPRMRRSGLKTRK